MQITLTFKDDYWPSVLAQFCSEQGYQKTIIQDGEVIRNPQSREDFLIETLTNFVQNNYVNSRVDSQLETLRQQERDRLK